jgi:response regulator RpfG family c-di-GMP phosphodiesterase
MHDTPEPADAMPDGETKGKESVLFVDDEPRILSSIRRLIRQLPVDAFFAESGKDGLKILEENHIDLVVSDMRMPEMDGAAFLAQVKAKWPKTVRMLLTGFADITSTISALNDGGIFRYISKPWVDEELKEIIMEGLKTRRLERERDELLLLTKKQNNELQDLNANLEKKVEARTQEIKQASDMLDLAYEELRESYGTFIRVFSTILSTRETLQKAQSQLVADFSRKIAIGLKLKDDTVQAIYYAALLHQLGKISLPDHLLDKPEELLTANERKQYYQYPLIGEAALTPIGGLERTAQLIRSHAELYDGSGFPDGLDGKNIKPGARIIRAVRDYIGLQTGTISKDSYSANQAMDYIKSQSGRKYDRAVVMCLEHYRKEFDISSLYSHEMLIESHALQPNMRLARDVLNSKGILLIAKGHVLNAKVIERIIGLEKVEQTKLTIYVTKETETVANYDN